MILTDHYNEIKKQIISMYPDMGMVIEDKNFFYRCAILERYKDDNRSVPRQKCDFCFDGEY